MRAELISLKSLRTRTRRTALTCAAQTTCNTKQVAKAASVALAEYERPNPRRGNNFPGVARHGKRFLSTLSFRARTTGDVDIGTPLSDVCGFETRISLASPQRSLEFQPYSEALATVISDSGGMLPKINNV